MICSHTNSKMVGKVHGSTFAVLVVICAAYAVVAVELPQWKEYLNTVVSRSVVQLNLGKLKFIRLTLHVCRSLVVQQSLHEAQ